MRVELELAHEDGPPFAAGWWAGLVGRNAQRELTARIAWSRGELVLEERPFAFTRDARPGPGAALVARARLRGGPHDGAVLEVGLRAPADTPRP
ncbi:MAG TPA: hypothetical protein VMT18_12850 [Planctomycetota bacterium]|nr:hypothetical protein [Planctomycetota bacterium]